MIFGNKKKFAIECKIVSNIDSWILGNFRFWILQQNVGDFNDSTDLRGCYNWLKDFVENPRDRFESNLMHMSAKEVFYLLYDSYMPTGLHYDPMKREPFKDTHGRFYISYLGMSSFDKFDILLIENNTQQRILWRDSDDLIIHDASLHARTVQHIAKQFCQWFSREQGIE
jgi:hypothetical protein